MNNSFPLQQLHPYLCALHAESQNASVFEQTILNPMDTFVGNVVVSEIESFQVFDDRQRFRQRRHALIRDLVVPQHKRRQPLIQRILK